MERKDLTYKGFAINGFLMLFVLLILIGVLIGSIKLGNIYFPLAPVLFVISILTMIAIALGLFVQEPNEARVMVFFGRYKGTFKETGFYWVNPLLARKKLSLRSRNLDVPPIKVNDRIGNPVMIGLVSVWRVRDTYKALFDIDTESMVTVKNSVANRMEAFEHFVKVQSDAALRYVAGQYAYDENEDHATELTLRGGGEEINHLLEAQLNERLSIAGIEVVEARLNYLAYAPEIAAVMLRRQQASAIIAAREKIVEGAVSMVKLALGKLSEENVVLLDEEKKAAMVSNLLVVLCADEAASPVINAGTLHH